MLRSGSCGASMTDAETFSKAKPPPTDDSPPVDPPSNSPTDFVSSFDATATSDNQIFRSALRDSSSSVDWLGREMFEMRPRERLEMWRPRDKVDHDDDDDDDKPLFLEESGVAQLVDIIKVVLLPLLSFIGKVTTSSTPPLSQEASNFDEVYMQQSLLFDDSLRDLKNLRTQLYSAAEYFELSYTNDDQKQIVVETLKDYAIKALANTVDHLGTVTYRVNDLLDEKVVEVSGVEQLGRP